MEINASSTSYKQRIKIIDKIFANAKAKSQNIGKSGIMLTGDPGVGKTSFIRFFSNLVGIDLITVEAPHITEEHIINIPFIVYDPIAKTEKGGSTDYDTSEFKVVLSDSNLYSKIKSIRKIPDEQYLSNIYSSPADVIKIFEELGGDKDTIPEDIAEIRENIKVILFLDEYFRQTSPKIRNMLRGILNNKIGSHDIPKDAFVIYATNLVDDGVEDIPLNNDFHHIKFSAPNKDDWFSWLVAKFENDKKVKLNKQVVDKFYKILSSEELNHEDFSAEVRVSPRRWEQLLLYISAALPVSNEKDAKNLISNIEANFKNYLTGQKAEMLEKVLTAVTELIEETSDIQVSTNTKNSDEEWKETLEHQIKMKMKLGEHRKYIPVISGLPGVGKTTHAIQIAKDLNLRYIYIDCSNLNPEDVVGLPIPKNSNRENIETQFTEPNLYHQIAKDVAQADRDHIEHLKHKFGTEASEKIKAYEKEEYKYLIFFDELNRNSSKVFNGIRRVLLEKSFGGGFDLPKGSVVMAAINPQDTGAAELTSHMRDVVDVIDAKADFKTTLDIMKNMPFKSLKTQGIKETVLDAIIKFSDKFKADTKVNSGQRKFFLGISDNAVYISPREYTDLFSNAVIDLDQKASRIMKHLDKMDEDEITEAEKDLLENLYESFESKLSNILTKHQFDSPEFLQDLKNWFMNSGEIDLGQVLFFKKGSTRGVEELLTDFFENPKHDSHLFDDQDFVNYLDNVDPQRLKEDLYSFLVDRLKSDLDIEKAFLGDKFKAKELTDGQIEIIDEEVSRFEQLMREINHSVVLHKRSNDIREIARVAMKDALLYVITSGSTAVSEQDLLKINMRMGKVFRKKA